jgi:hypothetical protein
VTPEERRERRERWLQTAAFLGVLALLGLALFAALTAQGDREGRPTLTVPTSSPAPRTFPPTPSRAAPPWLMPSITPYPGPERRETPPAVIPYPWMTP